MKILLSAATQLELEPCLDRLSKYKKGGLLPYYEIHNHHIDVCETGVGMLHTSYAMSEIIRLKKPDLVINIGIAGSYHNHEDIGNCYQLISEQQGDLGVSESHKFKTIFDLNLRDKDLYPYRDGKIIIPQEYTTFLPKAAGLTLNAMSPTISHAQSYRDNYLVDLESMEGAAVAYCCLMSRTPLVMLKSVSNVAGVRDKAKWSITLAINALADTLVDILPRLKKEETRLL